MAKNIQRKLTKIKLLLTDVDGVLTDGGRYYSTTGEFFKKFHVRDGMGVNILLRNQIKTAIITKEKSKIVKIWSKNMNIERLYDGATIKESFLEKICKDFAISSNEIAYIGDDVNDVELLKLVGVSACPHDAVNFVKKYVDYVCKCDGGKGAFRELTDLIIVSQFHNKTEWY